MDIALDKILLRAPLAKSDPSLAAPGDPGSLTVAGGQGWGEGGGVRVPRPRSRPDRGEGGF